MSLDQQTFQRQFEDLSLDPQHFSHLGHLRIAYLYLKQQPLEQALALMHQGIQAYATHLGASEKYHATITEALVRIMAKRLKQNMNWQTFVNDNQDLIENAQMILAQHYSDACLQQADAKLKPISPDLAPI